MEDEVFYLGLKEKDYQNIFGFVHKNTRPDYILEKCFGCVVEMLSDDKTEVFITQKNAEFLFGGIDKKEMFSTVVNVENFPEIWCILQKNNIPHYFLISRNEEMILILSSDKDALVYSKLKS